MMKKLVLLLFLFVPSVLKAQPPRLIDSLKTELANARTFDQKVEILGELSRVTMNVNLEQADEFGKQMIEEAELSRDRNLMVKAFLANGERALYMAGIKSNIDKAIGYFNQALAIAKKEKLGDETAASLLALARAQHYIPDVEKALNYTNQAFSLIKSINNDSLEAVAYVSYADAYLLKKDRLLALRNYLNALKISEELKAGDEREKNKKHRLLRMSYKNLSVFYMSIGEYDKAIDFAVKSMEHLKMLKDRSSVYFVATELSYIGSLYRLKKNFDISQKYYEQSIALADSLKNNGIKFPAYVSILNQFLEMKQPQKALDYFNGNAEMKQMITTYGLTYVIDQVYGYIYMDLAKYDSAKYYYGRAASFYENTVNNTGRIVYYTQVAELHKRAGETQTAIGYLEKAENAARNIGELEFLQNITLQLDSLYERSGDFVKSKHYSSLYHQYKDSLQKLGEEKELMQLEVADEQQRADRLAKEEAERKRQRHNIQYVGITIGIAILFITLVMMGMFRVSTTTIRVIGFFAFLMFFEFIFLVFKKKIYGITEGEPWKDLAFMILIAALLVPLHHWLEHRVIHYLTSRKLVLPSGRGILNKILTKQKSESN